MYSTLPTTPQCWANTRKIALIATCSNFHILILIYRRSRWSPFPQLRWLPRIRWRWRDWDRLAGCLDATIKIGESPLQDFWRQFLNTHCRLLLKENVSSLSYQLFLAATSKLTHLWQWHSWFQVSKVTHNNVTFSWDQCGSSVQASLTYVYICIQSSASSELWISGAFDLWYNKLLSRWKLWFAPTASQWKTISNKRLRHSRIMWSRCRLV